MNWIYIFNHHFILTFIYETNLAIVDGPENRENEKGADDIDSYLKINGFDRLFNIDCVVFKWHQR